MFLKCLDVHFRLVGMAGDSSGFRRLYLGELALQETFQVQVQEKAAMVGENHLVKGVDATLFDEGNNSGRDKDIVQALSAAAVGAGFTIGAVGIGMGVGKVALSDKVCKAVLGVAEALIKVSS